MPIKNGARLTGNNKIVKITICLAVIFPSGSTTGSIKIPAFLYCSRYIQAIARKCGNCHKKSIAKRIQAPSVISLEAAVQPINGGIAPGKTPNAVEARRSPFERRVKQHITNDDR